MDYYYENAYDFVIVHIAHCLCEIAFRLNRDKTKIITLKKVNKRKMITTQRERERKRERERVSECVSE